MKRNKFSKALKHLKSKKIDEKIKSLEEAAPTNNMSGVYQVTPSTGDAFRMGELDPARTFYPKADGTWPAGVPANAGDRVYVKGAGYHTGKGAVAPTQTITPRDFSIAHMNANGNDTSTMIRASDGMVYSDLPEGTRNFILGPLVTSYTQNHTSDDFTNIGYLQKDTRQFVLLARIQGYFDGSRRANGAARTWDGTSNQFTAFNSNFTLEHALWMLDAYNTGNFTENVPFNLSGGIPADRHPDNNSLGGGDAFGTDGANAGGDGDDDGQNQDPADVNDINSLNLAGMTYSDLPPKPKRSDYPNTRSGAAAFSRAMRKWNKLEAALAKKAGLETENPLFNQDNFDTVKDAASKFANILWTGAKIITGKAAADVIADLTINPIVDAAFGQSVADSASEYNKKLATSLATSVVTGKPHRIKLGKKGREDLINSIDTEMLKKHLTIGPTPDPTADNAINPGKGKVAGILKGAWGNQGGTHINYDPGGGGFTITSVKMLRNFGDLDKKDAGGKITNFEDIPNPSLDDVKKIFKSKGLEGPLKKFYNTMANVKISSSTDDKTFRPFAGGYDPDQAAEMMYDGFGNITKALYNFAMEGSASNAVHLRDQLLKAGFPKSDIEKMGGGFGGYVYSQEKYFGNDIPGNHSDANSVTGIVNRAAMKYLGISESRKIDEKNKVKILREIRQPLKEIKELPKTTKLKGYKPNFKGKYSPQNTPDVTASKQSDDIVSAKNASRQVWTAKDKFWKGYETTERMNIIYDNLGHGSEYFDRIVGENVRLKGKKSREVQEHLNMLAHQKAMKEVYGIKEYENFIDESETFDNKINDPLFTKVAKRLKKEIDYPKKPAAKGYPNEAPPKIDPNTGMHPKFGKRYKYDKLDPISAKTMAGAPTGDPEIDANVKRQSQKEDWRSDLKNLWLGAEREEWKKKLEEGMTTSDTFSYSVSGKGDVDLTTTGTGYTQDGVHQLQNIEPMTNVSDPTNAGKKFGKTHGYGGNTYGGINQYDSQSDADAGIEATYWNQPVTGPLLDDNTNLRFSDYIYPFDRDATQAEMEIGNAATKVRGQNDSFRAVYPTNVIYNQGHKTTPVVTNPTVGTDDAYSTVGLGVQFGHGADTRDPRFFVPNPVNTSEIDTVQILASLPASDSITSAGSQLQLFYWSGDKPGFQSLYPANPSGGYNSTNRQNDGWRPIAMKPNGETDGSVNSNLIDIEKPIGYEVGKVSKFSIQIPEWCRTTSTRFMFVQINGSGSRDNLVIYSIGYQRRNALTINTTLADEKASAFVRVGNNSQMAPEERKKKLNDMLKASRQYMLKSLGFASLFNDEVKISDVVSNNFDYRSVMQGSGAYGNARFHDIIDADKKVAAQKRATRSSRQRSRSTAYKRSFR